MPEIGDLYALAPEEFTARRNAVVRELRAAGDREGAAEVAKLRRPPVTAWALNQVARAAPDLIERLLSAGAGLRAAMGDAVAGDASSLRAAQQAERSAVEGVVRTAAGHVESSGQRVSDALVRRLEGTLRAAIIDAGVAAQLRGGVLDRDVDAPGLGFDGISAAGSAPSRRPDPGEREAQRKARARRAEREADADRLTRRAERLRGEAEAAARRADAARLAAEAAEAEADAARQAVDALG